MNLKKSIDNCIRGWLPKEPIFPTRTSATQTRPKISIFIQNAIIGLLLIAGLYCALFLINYSWIKIVLLGSILVGGILWLVSRGKLKMTLKYFVLLVLIFGIAFGSFESYVYWNAGYPPTYSPSRPKVTISMQTLLNASLTEIVQGIEQSSTFSILKLEHKEMTLQSIGLNPIGVTGGIYVTYFIEDTHSIVRFTSSGGQQYRVSISQLIGQPFSEEYSGMQKVGESLTQIDAVSLQAFYDKALQIAQNRTSELPTIDSLSISISYESYRDYQGLTLQMLGSHETVLPDGHINGEGVLIADFRPDGTVLYMSQPTPQ